MARGNTGIVACELFANSWNEEQYGQMARILANKKEYTLFDFDKESELEEAVIEHKEALFGKKTVYIDIKRKIGKDNHKGIPDAFLIDFFDPKKPQLYIVENELASHDVYSHITEQIARFGTSIATSAAQIREKIVAAIKNDSDLERQIESFLPETIHRTSTELLLALTEKNDVKIVLVINEEASDLNASLSIFKNKPDVVLFQRYRCNDEIFYYYTPMREEVEESELGKKVDSAPVDFDTVVCAAFEDGFKHAYVKQGAWWAIRLSQNARDNLRYLAIYQKSPLACISHYAEIDRVELYKDTGKYKLYLKNKKVLHRPIPLTGTGVGGAPQGPRFTTMQKLLKAKTVGDLWS